MNLIEIKPLENGAHDNNTIYGITPTASQIPKGWAIIPDDMPIPDTFPFVDIEVEGDNAPIVTKMTAGVVPPPPEPEPEPPTTEERLAAVESAMLAMMMGGNELV